jgi:hypothetical protein
MEAQSDFVNGNINKEHSIALSPSSSEENIDLAWPKLLHIACSQG